MKVHNWNRVESDCATTLNSVGSTIQKNKEKRAQNNEAKKNTEFDTLRCCH